MEQEELKRSRKVSVNLALKNVSRTVNRLRDAGFLTQEENDTILNELRNATQRYVQREFGLV